MQCRSCGAPITWTRNANNKAVPLNAAGENHFIDCPGRDNHRAKRPPAKPKPPKPEQTTLFAEPDDAEAFVSGGTPKFIPSWKK